MGVRPDFVKAMVLAALDQMSFDELQVLKSNDMPQIFAMLDQFNQKLLAAPRAARKKLKEKQRTMDITINAVKIFAEANTSNSRSLTRLELIAFIDQNPMRLAAIIEPEVDPKLFIRGSIHIQEWIEFYLQRAEQVGLTPMSSATPHKVADDVTLGELAVKAGLVVGGVPSRGPCAQCGEPVLISQLRSRAKAGYVHKRCESLLRASDPNPLARSGSSGSRGSHPNSPITSRLANSPVVADQLRCYQLESLKASPELRAAVAKHRTPRSPAEPSAVEPSTGCGVITIDPELQAALSGARGLCLHCCQPVLPSEERVRSYSGGVFMGYMHKECSDDLAMCDMGMTAMREQDEDPQLQTALYNDAQKNLHQSNAGDLGAGDRGPTHRVPALNVFRRTRSF